MSRTHAGLLHLAITLVILLIVGWVVVFRWFPSFFVTTDGGWRGLQILVGIQLVVGPMLTLLLFKPGKPGLKFDLALVGILQASTLVGGLYIIHSERPLFLVYYEDQFYSLSADTFTEYGVSVPSYRSYGSVSPAQVYVRLPDSPIEEANIRRILYHDKVPLWVYRPLYQPLSEYMEVVSRQGASENVIRQQDTHGELDNWLEPKTGVFDDYAFFPLHSRFANVYLGIRTSDGALIDILDVAPFHLIDQSGLEQAH